MLDKLNSISNKKFINIIGLVLLALFFLTRNPASKWDKTIGGDGKSYYAYLTTAFIYHDLDYQFIESYEAQYYPPDQSLFKEFRQSFGGEIANKTFPGITILWLPFFLLAHFLSYLFGFETDGYSILYQYSIAIAAIFYVWLGIRWLSQLMFSIGFQKKLIVASITVLVFGTNLFFYTIYDPSLTHAYNFALLAGMLSFVRQFFLEKRTKWLVIATVLFSIAIIIRPTNVLMIAFLPFALGSFKNLKSFFYTILKNKKLWLCVLGIPFIFAWYPIFWWYLQTGQFIVYSYGEEGFNFANPNFYKILFSYEKGWMVYTPIIFLCFTGFIYYFKQNRFLFFIGLIGFSAITYIFSCWWIWTYGASFGQRVFVDYYAVIAILLAAGLTLISSHKSLVILWFFLATGFVALNLFQTYQFKHGIIPSIGVNSETYWGSYFKLKAIKPSYSVDKPFEIIKYYESDFETKSSWITKSANTDTRAKSGNFSQFINLETPYSGGYKGRIPFGSDFIKISAEIYCENNSASPQLIYELARNANNSIYNSYALMPHLAKNEWTEFTYIVDLENFNQTILNTYFWNPTADNVWIDDIKITFGKYN